MIDKLINRITSFYGAINRFLLTILFLAAAVITNIISINSDKEYLKFLFTFLIGALLSAALQVVFERFFKKFTTRIMSIVLAIILTIGYYLLLFTFSELNFEIRIRTAVAAFALFIAFIWVPTIKKEITFNESFMVSFKAFFIAIFFASVLFIGVSLILTAVNSLLFQVNEKAYLHSANIIYVMFAPVYFLSLIPLYPGKSSEDRGSFLNTKEKAVYKMANCPKFLEILISYIIIPLTVVFTVILLLYIGLNIGEQFWTNNLLEPMLVIYSIIVILVYILSSNLENKFSLIFRKIFPKLLIPIVLLQTIASIIKISEFGIPFTRYYVILYGIFALCSGVVFSIFSVKRNGIVAIILILFSAVSLIPPVDAFSVGKNNQIQLLEETLTKNNMLVDHTIIPNENVSDKDKQIITQTVNYIAMMGYEDSVEWLPENFRYYSDFYNTFGFYEEYQNSGKFRTVYYEMYLPQNELISITGYDNFINTSIDTTQSSNRILSIKKSGLTYSVYSIVENKKEWIRIMREDNQEILSLEISKIFDETLFSEKGTLTLEEATFENENEKAGLKVVFRNISYVESTSNTFFNAEVYLMVTIKE